MSVATSHPCKRLVGKVAVVTASTEGIGLAIARRLAQEGAKVVVSSRKQKNVDEAVKNLRSEKLEVTGVVCHVAKADDRKRLFEVAAEAYRGVDILVSNAAANPIFSPILDTEEDAWDKIFDVNVKASFFLCKEAAPYMQRRGGGSIVLVSSYTAYQPSELLGPYAVSKTTLLGMIRALLPQLTQYSIRINAIAPGVIKTNFSAPLWKEPGIAEQINSSIPMGRMGRPEECAGPTAFLVSDDASYITGETLVMAGGIYTRL